MAFPSLYNWAQLLEESEAFRPVLEQLAQQSRYQTGEFNDSLNDLLRVGVELYQPDILPIQHGWASSVTLLSTRGQSLSRLEGVSAACLSLAGKFNSRRVSPGIFSQYWDVPTPVITHLEGQIPWMLDWHLNMPTVCSFQCSLLEPFLCEDAMHLLIRANEVSLQYYFDGRVFEQGLFWCACQSIVETLESQAQDQLKNQFLQALSTHPLEAISNIKLDI